MYPIIQPEGESAQGGITLSPEKTAGLGQGLVVQELDDESGFVCLRTSVAIMI
jgi:hypothetical protein